MTMLLYFGKMLLLLTLFGGIFRLIRALELPNHCGQQQYYDTASLSCQNCAVNNSLVKSVDGFSCTCDDHSIPLDQQRCRPCNGTELVSSDGNYCIPRKCQNALGKIVCRKCPGDYISVTKNFDGSPMKEVVCVKCSRGYKPQDNTCVRCDSCACSKKDIVVREVCVPKVFVNTRPKYEDKVLHPQELLDVVKFEYLCIQNDIHACQTIASMCVKNFYPSDLGGPCRLWLQSKTTNPKGLPNLLVSPTANDRKPGEIYLSRKEKSSLFIVAAVYMSNGGMKILDNFDEKKHPCDFPIQVKIGVDSIYECRVNITKLLSSDINETISPYLFIGGEFKQLPVKIRKPNGYNIMRGIWSSNKFTRFFLVHNSLSTLYNVTNTIYLRTLFVRIHLEREKHKNGSLRIEIDLEAQYAKSIQDEIVEVTWKVEHEMPSAGLLKGLEIWAGILGTFLSLYALIQVRGVIRRGGPYYSLVPLMAASIADTLYFAALFSTLQALAAEAGTLGLTLPLSRSEEHFVKVFILSAVCLKAVKVAWINFKQCTYDIFFLNWSEYNPPIKEMPFINENQSWKSITLAREWSMLQTLRRAHPGFTVTLALLAMQFVTPMKVKLPPNITYTWALFSITWWIAYTIILVLTWVKEKFFYSQVLALPNICTTVGLSLLVFQEENYAHYVHGRHSESKEVRSMAGPHATCRVSLVPQVRAVYKQLSTPGPGILGISEPRHALLSRFMAAFFERALDGLNWLGSERTLLERLLDVELTSRESGSTSALLYDDDVTPSCLSLTWWGEEWNLSTFDALVFSAIFIVTADSLVAALTTIVLWQTLKQTRQWFGNRNQVEKTGVKIYY